MHTLNDLTPPPEVRRFSKLRTETASFIWGALHHNQGRLETTWTQVPPTTIQKMARTGLVERNDPSDPHWYITPKGRVELHLLGTKLLHNALVKRGRESGLIGPGPAIEVWEANRDKLVELGLVNATDNHLTAKGVKSRA